MSDKVAVVIALVSFGDVIFRLPVLRQLKNDGYRVIFYATPAGKQIVQGEACVDEVVVWDPPKEGVIPIPNFPEGARIIDLTKADAGMVEPLYQYGCIFHVGAFVSGCRFCVAAKQRREDLVGHLNHEDLMTLGLVDRDLIGPPEMEFTAEERNDALRESVNRDWHKKFVVIWQQENSAEFKIYPYWFDLMSRFVAEHADAEVYAVGRKGCEFLQVASKRIIPITGEWSFRKAALMCTRAQLVVGVEGALLAGCAFDPVPKLMLMTCSNPHNIAKNWVNTTCIRPRVPCHPCHQLHFQKMGCALVDIKVEKPKIEAAWPICVGMGFSNDLLISELNRIYDRAQQPVGETFNGL